MRKLKIFIFSSFLLINTESNALNLIEFNRTVEDNLYDSRSCNDLYMQASSLEKQFFANTGPSNRTQVASLVSAVFTPALYYLGYSAYQDYQANINMKLAFAEIEEIRVRMAEKRCFIQ